MLVCRQFNLIMTTSGSGNFPVYMRTQLALVGGILHDYRYTRHPTTNIITGADQRRTSFLLFKFLLICCRVGLRDSPIGQGQTALIEAGM